MSRIVLNRIIHHLLDDVITDLRSLALQEKYREQNQNHYVLFVDLTKAFDTVSRGGFVGLPVQAWLSIKVLQGHQILLWQHDGTCSVEQEKPDKKPYYIPGPLWILAS